MVLKGDLPIGVDKRSVDTWMEPTLFRMDKSTGKRSFPQASVDDQGFRIGQ